MNFGEFSIPSCTQVLILKDLINLDIGYALNSLPHLTEFHCRNINLTIENMRTVIRTIESYQGLTKLAIENSQFDD